MSRQLRLFCAASCAAIGVVLSTCAGALALSGAGPVLSKGSTALGPAQGEQSIVLTLSPRRSGALQALAGAGTGRLTPAAFMSSYAPTTATVQAISTWAAKNGLKVSSVSADRLLVRVSGPARALGAGAGHHLRALHDGRRRRLRRHLSSGCSAGGDRRQGDGGHGPLEPRARPGVRRTAVGHRTPRSGGIPAQL